MFNFKKRFGQNFLVNTGVIKKIIDCFDSFDEIIEIGPGNGALTKSFLQKNKKITAIDIDIDCIQSLEDLSINLIHADILNYDLPNNLPLVGNLPYNISSKIVEKIVKNTVPYAVFMFQKEVADVLTGVDYGKLTVFAQSRYSIRKLMDVKPGCFFPVPKVTSQVVIFERVHTYDFVDLTVLNQILSQLFIHKRKKISFVRKKNLKLFEKIQLCGLNCDKRPEEISKEEFFELCKLF
ncbi:16S rRNA (adenine(1518)-N(6)/adenine(1519)-N(6))-dimethyltransferase RsmA [Alphaproteobacteria bacterium endosymbiont of Tiliacea citrago]|uniref:16S rRNA (adenine(1518)-N(6)/adenine(1519)-N(6))- dimethyltransferase RsmA n=1 Tax=Alphaproteobacteria bacterium endosymbiont of Tiliacea citrago TaxID=3077944 RepID=UPI00313E67C3